MEGDDAVVITIILSQTSSMQIQVEVNTMDMTATGNSNDDMIMLILMLIVDVEDYVGGMMMVTIAAGAMEESFIIDIADGDIVECTESFSVRMVSVTGNGVITGNINNAEVMIMDNDGK